MQTKKSLHKIDVASTDFLSGAAICNDGIHYQYEREGLVYISGIRFNKILAMRTRAERCCTPWHIENAYDTLTEIENSIWIEELRPQIQERWRNKWQLHHYLIYLDSAGCFEYIADSWDIVPTVIGHTP